jgi:hypothetical protein
MASSDRQDAPSPEEQRLLQVIFDRFQERGEWPLVDDLRYQLDQADDDLDVVAVGQGLDPALGLVYAAYQGRSSLTMHGVALCSGSGEALQDALRTIQYAYERYRAAGAAAELTSAGLAQDLGMDAEQLRRTYELIHWLPGLGGGSGDGSDAWSRQITADVTRFKRVETVAELLAVAPRPGRIHPVAPMPIASTWPVLPPAHHDSLRQLGEQVSREVERINANVVEDPAVAITSARALVESVCKAALAELGEAVAEHDNLTTLYKKTALALNVDPTQHQAVYRQTLQGLVSTVEGLAVLRNRLGSAHGPGRSTAPPDQRHARLAAGAAMTVAVFLVEALESVAEQATGRVTDSNEDSDQADQIG